MKWRKLGKLFDPADHDLPVGGAGFAQSPQALVLEDRVRVYFSTRERDAAGKFLSHIAYVDFDRGMTGVLGTSRAPVIPLGGLGCFDEHGIFPMHVCRDGSRILAFTTGWNRKVSVSADAAIGLAESLDGGATFTKVGTGPVMGASLHEPFLVGDAFVQRIDGLLHMWYIFGVRWTNPPDGGQPDRVYKIAHATSEDGIEWRRDAKLIIEDRIGPDECQALPTVFRWRGRYHMYFCYRAAHGFREDPSKAYRIGYAWSDDLSVWHRDDASSGIDVSGDGWDSRMQCYPNAFECDGAVYLLYNGNDFGREGFGIARLEDEALDQARA